MIISTHTLLAERDTTDGADNNAHDIISTLTLLAERDKAERVKERFCISFLLTRSSRSVTDYRTVCRDL